MNKRMKLSLLKVPVKVEQINENSFSDTVQSQKTKSGKQFYYDFCYRPIASAVIKDLGARVIMLTWDR